MNALEQIMEKYPDQEFLKMDGMDDAVIGVSEDDKLIYSKAKILGILQCQGMTWEEAIEYFDFNIGCAHVGEKTPVIMDDLDAVDEMEIEVVEETDELTAVDLIMACYYSTDALTDLGEDEKLISEAEARRQRKAKAMIKKMLFKGINDLYDQTFPITKTETE